MRAVTASVLRVAEDQPAVFCPFSVLSSSSLGEEILLKSGMIFLRLQHLQYLVWRDCRGDQDHHPLACTIKIQRVLHSCVFMNLLSTEACPFCRRVREAMTELDLSVEVYPCPKGSLRHREMVRQIGGKQQYPFLIDLNTGVSMYESGDIVKYLFQQYGQGRKPSFGLLESTMLTGWVPTLLRAGRGMTAWNKAGLEPPSQLLELFSYENNPYGRIVREALCELELPYILHNVGEGSSRSELLFKASGSNEVPYLIDPNTGFQMGDYKQILSYLFKTYCSG